MLTWMIAVVVLASTASLGMTATVSNSSAIRDPKLFPVVQIVTFENGPCVAASGEQGTCFSQKECDDIAGASSGTCANGFGVCCVLYTPCGGTVSVNGSYFISPTYPASYSTPGMCVASITPPAGTCQILLNFDDFELVGPVAGDCTNDTFVVIGANPGPSIPTLCGFNTGQHMFVDVDNSQGPYKLVTTLSSFNYQRRWKIKVTFISMNTPCRAPNMCLQYFMTPTGTFSSFNYGGTPSMMINDQQYSICFAYQQGYCNLGINYNRFDLGNVNQQCTTDFVASAGERLCGDFATFTNQVNATGPINLLVSSDGVNDREEEGFSASYMMMAC
ncbi:uncharacterized protein [Cherax quadricarinatus]|uniref:uncharacterized protein n=1 Tax=Cherax quadricarinatus TaxID=27406 RepID=UPI0023789661|nr:uncharacterized protein LOC128687278 [Cherax quadricarinatus]